MKILSQPRASALQRGAQHFCKRRASTVRPVRSIFRSHHNFALTREVSDSFVNSLSKYAVAADPINLSLAKSQHDHYVSLLRTKIPTIELPPLESYPDSVFVEDTVVAYKKRAVITCPGHVSRQGEVDSIRTVLEQLGMDVWDMREKDNSAICDGGDVLNTGRHMFVGLSDRTNEAGARILEEAFYGDNLEVVPVNLDSNDALHLKSVITHLDEQTLLAPQRTIGDKLLQEMNAKDLGYGIVFLPDIRACNVATVNDSMVLASDSICDESRRILQEATRERGLDLRFVGTTEVEKSDGALTCCSVLLNL